MENKGKKLSFKELGFFTNFFRKELSRTLLFSFDERRKKALTEKWGGFFFCLYVLKYHSLFFAYQ